MRVVKGKQIRIYQNQSGKSLRVMCTRDYNEYLFEKLKDPEEAKHYLIACLEEGGDVFVSGLMKVAKAQGIISTDREKSVLVSLLEGIHTNASEAITDNAVR